MLEIAGLVVSGISLLNDLFNTHRDLKAWAEQDLQVDGEWLPLAISKGLIPGTESDYTWPRAERVPTLELKETHQVVVAHNEEKKILYRIVRGSEYDRLVLMKKITSG